MIPQGGFRWAFALTALPLSFALLTPACSDDERTFGDPDADGGTSGQGGEVAASGNGAGGSSGSQSGAAGSSTGGSSMGGSSMGGSGSGGTGDGEGGSAGEPEPMPCGGLVCQHGGVCDGEAAAARCDCAGTGYDGETCEENIDECDAEPCANEGVCSDSPGSYSCDCSASPRHAGRHCDLLRFEPLPATFKPYGVSPDGGVVVGANDNTIAHKYVDGEAVFLGFLIGDNSSIAYGASEDGEVIVGASGTNSLFDTSRPVRWNGADVAPLAVDDGYTMCQATGVSADGRVIVGTCTKDGYVIVRWVDGTFEPLGKADGVEACMNAVVSGDGSTVGGLCTIYPSRRGFVWTESAGFKLLPTLATATNCSLSGLSRDGTAATGQCVSGNAGPGSAYVWTAGGGTKALPKDASVTNGYGSAISADGQRVLGAEAGAALWDDPEAAPTLLVDLLPATTPGLSNWALQIPIALSADGKTIVGQGSLSSATRHYIARLDE